MLRLGTVEPDQKLASDRSIIELALRSPPQFSHLLTCAVVNTTFKMKFSNVPKSLVYVILDCTGIELSF
jgi:hypothetical protein